MMHRYDMKSGTDFPGSGRMLTQESNTSFHVKPRRINTNAALAFKEVFQ
jgi:hypothetical protein